MVNIFFLFIFVVFRKGICDTIYRGESVDANIIENKNNVDINEYKFVFRQADSSLDALYIQAKHKKNKRTFKGVFNKSTLVDMNLKQSIPKIINLLQSSQNGLEKGFTFKIGFGKITNNEKVLCDQLISSYVKGYALYISVLIEKSWYSAQHNFALIEQKREEIDILRDIIDDLQEEIKNVSHSLQSCQHKIHYLEQETKTKKFGIAQWKCDIAKQIVPWNIESIPSTLQGMVTTENNGENIVIGISGYYKISARFGLNTDWGNVLQHELRVNGNAIAKARTYHSHSNMFVEVLKLKKGDYLQYYVNSIVSGSYWKRNVNSFLIEYIETMSGEDEEDYEDEEYIETMSGEDEDS